MEGIKQIIKLEKKKIATREFFISTLKSEDIPVEKRLHFLPSMAYFAMAFSDLNKHVLSYPCPKDKYEEAINAHSAEDSTHWPMFINDLKVLNLNTNQDLTTTLIYLWSDEVSENRKLSYTLIPFFKNQHAVLRYIAIESVEAVGNVLFKNLRNITFKLDLPIQYCNDIHLSLETGHSMATKEDVFDDVEITDEIKEFATSMIESIFEAFTLWIDELDRNLKKLIK
ncbi:hypothetical protein CYY_006663 [Polysphondylium violaceum]|uniref:Uncharacterized protein n=1 Tax=Polysphondylium violaceum TaxID=133409 RepID=A0A8J4V5N1_9MYCE|nr:hypothetical protein CYY_006663 [Polysphondylium violaceum]